MISPRTKAKDPLFIFQLNYVLKNVHISKTSNNSVRAFYEFLSRSAIALLQLHPLRLVDNLWLFPMAYPEFLIAEDHRVKTQRTTELMIRINPSVVLCVH